MLGPNHIKVGQSLHDLAKVYYRRGTYQRAEELFQRALQIREAALGTNHPDVAQTRASLAYLFTTLGKFNEAEEYYKVKRRTPFAHRQLASSHLRCAVVCGGVCGRVRRVLCVSQLGTERAVHHGVLLRKRPPRGGPELQRPRLDLYAKHFLPSCLVIFYERMVCGVCVADYRQARYQESEELYRRSLDIRSRYLGEHHPDTARSFHGSMPSISTLLRGCLLLLLRLTLATPQIWP